MNTPSPLIHVAVGILRRQDGQILLASRPPDKPWSGYWEFPGGKIEAGESPYHALVRELQEELAIQVTHALPWLTLTHHYPTTVVRLHCFIIETWKGMPVPQEGQQFVWQTPSMIEVAPLLPANAPLLRALSLPNTMGITHIENDYPTFLSKLDLALSKGLRLIQLRDERLDEAFATEVLRRAYQYAATVVINRDLALAQRIQADGVHLTAHQLKLLSQRPDFNWVGASCHNAEELNAAERLGCDYALLSPVLPTTSHPDATALGWTRFSILVQGRSLPIYALGGMTQSMLPVAQENGAHGIALLRGVWS